MRTYGSRLSSDSFSSSARQIRSTHSRQSSGFQFLNQVKRKQVIKFSISYKQYRGEAHLIYSSSEVAVLDLSFQLTSCYCSTTLSVPLIMAERMDESDHGFLGAQRKKKAV